MKKTWNKETAARQLVTKDYMRRMVGKSKNVDAKPWKSQHYNAKDTPFGNFTGPRTRKKQARKTNIFEEQASTQILLGFALQNKKKKDFGIKMKRPKVATKGDPFKPKSNLLSKKRIEPSLLPMFYDRGDLPIKIVQQSGSPGLTWLIDCVKLDYKFYLPLFFDGLRERKDPYRMIALIGSLDLLEAGGIKVVEVIPQLIMPLKKALMTRDMNIMSTVLRIIQKLVRCHKYAGLALVPYYRQLLPSLNLFKGRSRRSMAGDGAYQEDTAELIQETLEVLESTGGEDAFIHIKYMIPTYSGSFSG